MDGREDASLRQSREVARGREGKPERRGSGMPDILIWRSMLIGCCDVSYLTGLVPR